MGKLIDLTGQRFGRLKVIARAENTRQGKPQWLCECDCGNRKIVYGYSLTRGATKSCGCLLKETTITKNTTHGKRHMRIYRIWASIHERCNYPAHKYYKNYGGRGIRVCAEWDDFFMFYEWALANGYQEGLTIDRIDTNGNYEPSNCRWVTMKVQNNNRRNNHLVTYKGQTKTLSEWAEEFQINRYTLYKRIQAGWSVEKALETPVQFHNKHR